MRNSTEARLWLAAAACAVLVACGGGGGSSGGGAMPPGGTPTPPAATPTPVSTPTPPGPSNVTATTTPGAVNGLADQFTPTNGDTATGGQGQTIDGIPCGPFVIKYHVHPYLALYVNGTQYAIPHGLGMKGPSPAVNGFVNSASCFYYLHTHDSSGIIHVEAPAVAPISQSLYTLKTFLDLWGIAASANNFGPFNGPVRVFTSGLMQRPEATVMASTLTYFGSDPNAVPLYSHQYIVIEVGPTYPAGIPNIKLYEQQ